MPPDEKPAATTAIIPPNTQAGVATPRPNNSEQAADVVRSQIDSIYDKGQANEQQGAQASPYDRTHDESQHIIATNTWQRYHSAWQSYYQQYYERYYVGQVHSAKKSLEDQVAGIQTAPQPSNNIITRDEAIYDLRSKLRDQVQAKAKKVRGSRHFIPAIAAVGVMLVFLFLQYNRVLLANVEAYVTPGNINPSTLIVDPSATTAVGPEPKVIIPKIAIEVPIIWDATASDQNSLNAAMDKGVAWFNIPGASARPGEIGNFAVSGHSSNDWLDKGDYKFIFARLEQLQVGDIVYANYNGTRYTYNITKKLVVKPTDVSALTAPTDKPTITLITCTPLGTALNRLLVFGDQVSPDPKSAAAASVNAASSAAKQMPSNSPTFFQRIFGLGG